MVTVLKDAFSVTRISFWTGTLASAMVGGLLYVNTMRTIESDAQERFLNHAKYAQSVIGVRIKSYTDLLRATGSLLQSAEITHDHLHGFVSGVELSKNYPAVDSINLALYVPNSNSKVFVDKLRKELLDYVGPQTPINISPPGERPSYLIVAYIEPDLSSPGHYGTDLMANPYFTKQLAAARDDGSLSASGSRIPALSGPNNAHLGMRMPIYRKGAPVETVEQRRAAYVGSLGIAFSLPRLLHGVLDELPVSRMRMTLYDMGPRFDGTGRPAPPKRVTLFDSQGSAGIPAPPLAAGSEIFTTTLPLDFNGRPWKTVFSVPKDELYTGGDRYYPRLMLAFGFLGSMMLYALLHMLTSSRRAALALAQEMTTELRESQHKLQLSHQKLRRLADHAYQIKELERKRIAREIHDDLGQSLLALRIDAELLAGRTRPAHGHLHKRVQATLQQIDATIKSVRQIINDLRPTVLDLGLSAAVEWQVNQFQQRTGIQCEVHDDHGDISVSDSTATAFFRILQESLTNIVRHADATRAVVHLQLNDGWLTLTVKDNGCGLPPGGRNKHGSFGLVGIEERIIILGGTCTVVNEPEGGTKVTVSAPIYTTPENPPGIQHHHPSNSAVI